MKKEAKTSGQINIKKQKIKKRNLNPGSLRSHSAPSGVLLVVCAFWWQSSHADYYGHCLNWVVEVKKSVTSSTDLEIVIDDVSELSSSEESIVLLCLLLFHIDSSLDLRGQQPLESTRNVRIKNFEVWNDSSHREQADLYALIFLAESTSLIHTTAIM